MQAIYDANADTLTRILRGGEGITERDEVKPGVIMDFDKEGHLVSLEILDACTRVTETRKMEFEVVS